MNKNVANCSYWKRMNLFIAVLIITLILDVNAFAPGLNDYRGWMTKSTIRKQLSSTSLNERLSKKRREQLGVGMDEDEYDLGVALNNNTDPLITKIIAGSLILVIMSLLVVAIVIPSMTDYGGACNPMLTAGRC